MKSKLSQPVLFICMVPWVAVMQSDLSLGDSWVQLLLLLTGSVASLGIQAQGLSIALLAWCCWASRKHCCGEEAGGLEKHRDSSIKWQGVNEALVSGTDLRGLQKTAAATTTALSAGTPLSAAQLQLMPHVRLLPRLQNYSVMPLTGTGDLGCSACCQHATSTSPALMTDGSPAHWGMDSPSCSGVTAESAALKMKIKIFSGYCHKPSAHLGSFVVAFCFVFRQAFLNNCLSGYKEIPRHKISTEVVATQKCLLLAVWLFHHVIAGQS